LEGNKHINFIVVFDVVVVVDVVKLIIVIIVAYVRIHLNVTVAIMLEKAS